MDFELSEDQQALRAAAAELLAGRSGIPVVRAAMERGGTRDPKLWTEMVDQGWFGLAVSEDAGGLGLGWVEAAVVLEQVGQFVAPAPVLGQMVALELLAGTEWGDRLIGGEAVAALAFGLDQTAVDAPAADVLLVPRDGRLVAIDLAECRPDPEPAMDLTRQIGWVRSAALEGAPVVDLGGEGVISHFVDVGALAYSAELLGIAQRALDMTVEYAKDRMQFGRPIGSFQAVKHRCADMLVDVEGMRSAVYWAAWCVATRDEDASVSASTAKTWCSDAARRVLASALQVHGGIGFTWEHDLHLYLKRSHLDEISFGDAAYHRARLATMLRSRVDAGRSVL